MASVWPVAVSRPQRIHGNILVGLRVLMLALLSGLMAIGGWELIQPARAPAPRISEVSVPVAAGQAPQLPVTVFEAAGGRSASRLADINSGGMSFNPLP